MNQVTKNPGCQRECRLDCAAGFVIEPGCPAHDRVGYKPFDITWIIGHPCLVGTIVLRSASASEAHEHVLVAQFLMGLN